jgi:DNA-binding MarR family transcriptional regulator
MGKSQKDAKKRSGGESVEQQVLHNLFRTSDRMQHRLAQLVADHDLTGSQYNVLRILRDEGKPMPCLKIAQRTITVVPGITGLVDRLEKRGLVKRDRSTEDRRVVDVSLTDDGEELLARIDEPMSDLHKKLLGQFNAPEVAELARLLEKARVAIEADKKPGKEKAVVG